MERGFGEVRGEIRETNAKLDGFIRSQVSHDRQADIRLDDHDTRIAALEQRPPV